MADNNQSTVYTITGILPKDACVVIIKTDWNAEVTDELEAGAVEYLNHHGIKNHKTIVVPGAVEIPFAIHSYWEKKKNTKDRPDAFIALGCVIRGETPHFDYVCQSVTQGVTLLNTRLPVPVIFGVLTVENMRQAQERLGGMHGHKGEEAAVTALKMIALSRSFEN
jgi:6,7-dimethyl-8-ribityllumazine synthase